jgi:hypothetical protein
MKAGDEPSDPEVQEPYSLEAVFDWLQDCHEQIKRPVILAGDGRLTPKEGIAEQFQSMTVSCPLRSTPCRRMIDRRWLYSSPPPVPSTFSLFISRSTSPARRPPVLIFK